MFVADLSFGTVVLSSIKGTLTIIRHGSGSIRTIEKMSHQKNYQNNRAIKEY